MAESPNCQSQASDKSERHKRRTRSYTGKGDIKKKKPKHRPLTLSKAAKQNTNRYEGNTHTQSNFNQNINFTVNRRPPT